jgi:predicted ferric reductase
MSVVVRGIVWLALFVAVAVAPLIFAAVGVAETDRGFATEFSSALGFVGVMLMGLEFALVARFRSVAAPFGTNALLQFHRNMGLVGLGLVAGHVAISAQWDSVVSLFDASTPWRVRFGVAAAVALTALIATSVWRTRLRLTYEAWHRLHALLAVIVVATAMTHALLVDFYIDAIWKQVLWVWMGVGFLALLGWIRIVRPMRLRRRPWEIVAVTPVVGDATTLTMAPVGHDGIRFDPGQYAWFAIDRSPLTMTKHPFSFSSSAEQRDSLEITIKALGDFTSSVADLRPGSVAYVDGPYGVFSPDRHQGEGFGFVVGGIGATPAMSILRTLADRGDRRPLVAFVANVDDQITFRDELDELRSKLDLEVVHVLESPPDGWTGEVGLVDRDVLGRHLPESITRWRFFLCGPDPMMDAVEIALCSLGVPGEHIHSERFGWI